MPKIYWQPYVWKQARPAASGAIEQLEASWGVHLPDEYKGLVSIHQGMTPEPSAFEIGRGENVFNTLLTVTEDEGYETYSIRHVHRLLRPLVPEGIYPFGDTPGGEYLCFDFRGSLQQPRIVLVTIEATIHPVANSFQELMEGLHD